MRGPLMAVFTATEMIVWSTSLLCMHHLKFFDVTMKVSVGTAAMVIYKPVDKSLFYGSFYEGR